MADANATPNTIGGFQTLVQMFSRYLLSRLRMVAGSSFSMDRLRNI